MARGAHGGSNCIPIYDDAAGHFATLAVLQESELVTVRRDSTRRLYRANRQAIARLRSELATLWDTHLPMLKDAAEAAARKERRR